MSRLTPNGLPSIRESNSLLISGGSLAIHRFSPSRRMFCLLTAFDFLFTLVAWVIYSHALKEGLWLSFDTEVAHYKFKSSLFDLLFDDSKGHPMDFVLVTMSLVLCWIETWVLDFKVIPSENEVEQRSNAGSLETTAGERRPLLGENYTGIYNTRTWLSEHASFYTPHGSRPGTPYESDDDGSDFPTSIQDKEFQRKAKDTFDTALQLLTMEDNTWNLEKAQDGITISSHLSKETGKLFKAQCIVDARPKDVFTRIVLQVEDGPKWNDSIAECRILHKIDQCTDLCYSVTTDQAGGMVSSRDFVNLRHWQKRGNAYVSCNVSVEFDKMPPVKPHIRGTNHPGGWCFAEKDGCRNKTDFMMVVNTDLKGWLPQYLIDQAMTGVLFGTAQSLRRYVHQSLILSTDSNLQEEKSLAVS
ncbi:stAR-related lipid transfer protein 3 isoform X2 [Nematostella vectensis]|uniref:stAR-related lipid transfer protein 3 isoform X2 n=1 Tax=Nematostella vectensis TaxID=45351 RepID=UPI00138FD9C9|nr:stAR-related lipid transfer protein 3 isoform X2 [Nematostella vectensis]